MLINLSSYEIPRDITSSHQSRARAKMAGMVIEVYHIIYSKWQSAGLVPKVSSARARKLSSLRFSASPSCPKALLEES